MHRQITIPVNVRIVTRKEAGQEPALATADLPIAEPVTRETRPPTIMVGNAQPVTIPVDGLGQYLIIQD
ncbi:MAG: hypothetical protein A2029_10645 [Chloroflexi bacterium RBG_19FT_COMBO_47_9]|nr:MAG: hypothetical protein A2029_10645 [Chloroflexi bacterium RBG_19FT_COMBO_47_9]